MKTIYKHIAFAALALSAVACSQEDEFAPSYLSDPDAVRITAQVGTADVSGGFTRSNPVGTVEEQAKFNPGDQISVTARTQAPVTYQLGDDGWNPVGETYLKWQTSEMDVTAYYPVVEGASATTFTVPTGYNVPADIAKADYMTYSGKQTKGNDKSINLAMQRKMVRIVIDEIHFNDQFFEGWDVTGITVHANTTGYVNGEPAKGDISVTAYHESDVFYALLAPTTADAEATFLTVTVNSGSTSQVLTVKGIPATTAGNSYSFSLTVGKNEATMGAVSVKDWTGATIPDGEAEEVKVSTVTEGTTATIIIPDLATDAMVQEALENLNTEGITTINVDGPLNEARQKYIADALAGKEVKLYLAQLTEDELIDALKNNNNIEVICGYYIAEGSTFVVYSANGLLAWNAYAQANPATNLSLKKDVTLPLADDAASNWTSVGTEATPYTGTVNGNGYSVTGMTINQTSQDAGFIGYLGEGGAVRNLTLKDVSVTSTADNVGAFVGRAYHTTVIENCVVESGTISSEGGKYIGGVVGCTLGSNDSRYETFIIACSNKADVSGRILCGGILGGCFIDDGDFTRIIACYNSGYISSNDGFNGGITGDINTGLSSILCCYNTGETNGNTGISGRNHSRSSSGHNYWSSSHNWASGKSTYAGTEYNNDAATKITDASGWESAMATMNTWLAENGYEYRYVLNTDAATKDAQPLVIVAVTAGE